MNSTLVLVMAQSHYLSRSSKACCVSFLIFALTMDVAFGLNCFYCTSKASPLCDSSSNKDHVGKELPCPLPDLKIPRMFHFINDRYVCFIMRTTSYATKAVEITKGCLLFQPKYFLKDEIHSGNEDLEMGECYTHSDFVLDKDADSHEVRVCICDQDNCNRKQINGTGFEDLKDRKKRISGATTEDADFVFTCASMAFTFIFSPLFFTSL